MELFIRKIPGFMTLSSGMQIKFLVYFLQFEKKYQGIKPKDVFTCFETLHLNPYSNIAGYLSYYSRKGKNQQFLKKYGYYVLYSKTIAEIEAILNKPIEHPPSNNLFPLAIFEETRGYLCEFSKEASTCYDLGLYNSCLFLLRKICEILIIELFESRKIQTKIQNQNNDYFQLSDLIKSLISEPSWKLSKIVKEDLPKIKLLADSSVHSKRFSAKKPDIDNMKVNIRIIFEELVSLIDYNAWNLSKK
jgi:hypothetical protein